MDETTDQPEPETPAPPAKPRPIAVAVGKRERVRLVKAELLMELAITAERWAGEIDGSREGMLPFDQWPDHDQRKQLCHTYQVTPDDLARICRRIAQEIENSSVRRGYEQAWR